MNGQDRSDLRDLAAAYALGALNREDAAAFEEVMARDPELTREVAEYREVQALLAEGHGLEALGGELKTRVMARIAAEGDSAPGAPPRAAGRRNTEWWFLAAAGVALAAGAGLLWREVNTLRRDLAANLQQLAVVRDSLSSRSSALATLLAAEADLTVVQLVAAGPQAPGIQLFWNRRTNTGLLHAFRLQPAPAGRVYQLWLIRDGVPIPSQLFNSDASGTALVVGIVLPSGDGVTAAAITEEPAGGSPQPTTPVLLLGTLPSS